MHNATAGDFSHPHVLFSIEWRCELCKNILIGTRDEKPVNARRKLNLPCGRVIKNKNDSETEDDRRLKTSLNFKKKKEKKTRIVKKEKHMIQWR